MQRKTNNLFKPLDFLIILIAIGLVVVSLRVSFSKKAIGSQLIVTSQEGEWVHSLNTDMSVGVQGSLGVSIIKLENGTAFFASSPCDNQICVLSHPIQSNMDFIACLPNQVFIRVEAETENAVDLSERENFDIIGY